MGLHVRWAGLCLPSPPSRGNHLEAFLLLVPQWLPLRTPNDVFMEVLSLIFQLLTISMAFPFWKMKLYLPPIQYPLTPLPTLPID